MAQRQVTVFIDDISGEELTEDGETVSFALDGVQYEIDLSGENAEELRQALATYIEHARRTGGRSRASSGSGGGGSRRSGASSSSGRRSSSDTQAIRAWAQQNGHTVSDRGRIPSSVIEAYEAAH
jgi:hypothetical protein